MIDIATGTLYRGARGVLGRGGYSVLQFSIKMKFGRKALLGSSLFFPCFIYAGTGAGMFGWDQILAPSHGVLPSCIELQLIAMDMFQTSQTALNIRVECSMLRLLVPSKAYNNLHQTPLQHHHHR